jgi:polyhydroxyalkanoate synthesis regulator phasin
MAPQNDNLKRYFEAGVAFTQMTRERAEEIVQELVKQGEIRRKEAEKNIEELLERSRRNTDDLLGIIRREVAEQLRNLGLDDLANRAGGTPAPAAPKAEPDEPASAPAAPASPVNKAAKKAAKAAKKATKKAGS